MMNVQDIVQKRYSAKSFDVTKNFDRGFCRNRSSNA